jgi:hypothetical protein
LKIQTLPCAVYMILFFMFLFVFIFENGKFLLKQKVTFEFSNVTKMVTFENSNVTFLCCLYDIIFYVFICENFY